MIAADNDFDLEIDKVNAPERPLPSGVVSPRDVLILSTFVTTLGFLSSYLINTAAFVVSIFVWSIGFLYNWRYKRSGIWGNLMVAFSVGMTFIFGAIVVGNPFDKLTWLFGMLAFLIDLGEEIAADAMDVSGDRDAGSRSLAILLGKEKALRISGAIFGSVIVTSLLPFTLQWLDRIYLIPIILMDIIIFTATIKLLQPNEKNKRLLIRIIYFGAGFAMLLLIILRMFYN